MNEEILSAYYLKKGSTPEQIRLAVASVSDLENQLLRMGASLETATVPLVREHVAVLVEAGLNTSDRLLALARYFYLTGAREIYIYFTALFNSQDVMENIRGRIAEREGEEAASAVFVDIEVPPLGAPLTEMPSYTQKVMAQLAASRTPDQCARILAGNNHGLSRESQLAEKKFLAAADSLDDYLAGLHQRKIAELQDYCDTSKVWFEQIITQEVVNFVASNQEILSAVRSGNRLYVTKIPYDTVAYLHATDPDQRKYFLCHCPFVRESLLDHRTTVDPTWCYCSGGFTKFPFDVLFDRDLTVELLESPLLGHDRCRFAIDLPEDLT